LDRGKSLGFGTAWAMQNYKKAKEYREHLDKPGSFIKKLKTDLSINKACMIDDHLSIVVANHRLEISHLTLLLSTYQSELPNHSKHHIHILKMRAEKYVAEQQIDKAILDFEEILSILDRNKNAFEKKQKEEVEKRISILRKKFPKKPIQSTAADLFELRPPPCMTKM
jgi:hypothetical protein